MTALTQIKSSIIISIIIMKQNRLVLFCGLFAACLLAFAGQIYAAAVTGFVASAASVPWSQHQQGVFAFNPIRLPNFGFMHGDPELHGGGAEIKQVIAQVKGVADQTGLLLKNYEQLDKTVKDALEGFDKSAKRLDSVEDIVKSMSRLQKALRTEGRSVFGSPAKRIAYDEEKRNLFLARLCTSLEIVERAPKHIRAICKDLDEANTPGSTYMANNELERDIYDLLATYGVFSQFDVRMIGAKATEVRLKTARVAAVFVDEAAQMTADSTKAGSKVAVTPGKIGALISVSTELLEDDVGGLVEDVLNDIAESIAYRIDWIAIAADGGADSTDGGFTGIMGGGGTDRTAASGNVSIATLDYEDVLACVTNLPVGLLQRGTVKWLFNPTILAKLLLIKGSDGRPIFNTPLDAPSYGGLGTIFGFPVVTSPVCPSTDSAGNRVGAFGDFMAEAIRIRRGITFDRSKDWAFDTDEVTFRGTCRAGAKVKAATAFQVLKLAAS